jgi:hypothetical protein
MVFLPATDFKHPILPTVKPRIIKLHMETLVTYKRAGKSTGMCFINPEVRTNTLKINDVL